MARPVTLRKVVERARIHADMRNTRFMSDSDALDLLNDIYPKLYNVLVTADEDYYAANYSFAVTGESYASYPLPEDFFKMSSVLIKDGGPRWTTLYPFNEIEMNAGFTATSTAGTVTLRYIPAPPTFASLDEQIDGIAGWDRMLALLLAIDFLDAEESNTDRLYRKYQEELRDIQGSADTRDMGMPGTVTDITRRYPLYGGYDYTFMRYKIRGNNIEFVTLI